MQQLLSISVHESAGRLQHQKNQQHTPEHTALRK